MRIRPDIASRRNAFPIGEEAPDTRGVMFPFLRLRRIFKLEIPDFHPGILSGSNELQQEVFSFFFRREQFAKRNRYGFKCFRIRIQRRQFETAVEFQLDILPSPTVSE